MKLVQNRRLHRMRVKISCLDERYQPEAMRAAVAIVASGGIMLRARRRVVVRLGWPVRLMVVAVRNMNGVRLAASGNHGKYRRQRRSRHNHGQQKRECAFDSEATDHAPNSSKCRLPVKPPGIRPGPSPQPTMFLYIVWGL